MTDLIKRDTVLLHKAATMFCDALPFSVDQYYITYSLRLFHIKLSAIAQCFVGYPAF